MSELQNRNENELERKILIDRVQNAFLLTVDLVNHISDEALVLQLPNLPSNSIGEQFWCIVGARESYLKAIENSSWSGFSCSLKDVKSKSLINASLNKSREDILMFLTDYKLNEQQLNFVFILLEHEIQHHGQLIRYIYGNKLTFPESWKQRYNV